MDLVESIASYSTIFQQAQLRSAVAVRVFKMAQRQDQAAADMVTQTLDAVKESIESFANELGTKIDSFA